MNKPYMPFYPGDYLGDTMHLTLEEHGAYLKLLFCMWRAGGWLDDDTKKICQILSITKGRWERLKPSLEGFFLYHDGKFSQQRLLAEREKSSEKSAKNALNGKQGGIAKHKKNINTNLANATNSLKRNASIARVPSVPEPESEPSKEEKSKYPHTPKGASGFALPDWVNKTDWDDFEEMRKRIKKPMTDRARREIIDDLERFRAKGYDPAAILVESIKKSWQGVFEPKGNYNGKSSRHTNLTEIDYTLGLDGFSDPPTGAK